MVNVGHVDFSDLVEFEDPVAWRHLSRREREALAELFIWRARNERDSLQTDPLPSLDLAERIAGDNARILHAIGIYWTQEGQQEKQEALLRGCHYFGKASRLRPKFRLVYWDWAMALTKLAAVTGDFDYFIEAEDKFCLVEWEKLPSKSKRLNVLWDWGTKWSRSGELSGEPMDYQLAIQKFERAYAEGLKEIEFLVDYAKTIISLSNLLKDSRYLIRALQLFMDAVTKSDRNPLVWYGLGTVLHVMFDREGEREHFERASQAFEAAAVLSNDHPEVVVEWARHLLRCGEKLDDPEVLEKGLALFDRLEKSVRSDPDVLIPFLRAMTLLGTMQERLDLLHLSEGLAREALANWPSHCELRCELGDVLVSRGHYFGENAFFRQAMEHYVHALASDRDSVGAHMGMAQAGYALGCATRELAFLEKAARHLNRATQIQPHLVDAWSLWALTQLKCAEISDDRDLALEGVDFLQKAINLEGGLENTRDTELLFNFGCALDYSGTFGEEEAPHRQSVEVLRRVVRGRPEDGRAHFHLGLAWMHVAELSMNLDDYHQAAEALGKACVCEPEEGVIWDEWGCALLSLASLVQDATLPEHATLLRHQAEEKIRRAVALGHTEGLYHLACCACQAGDLYAAMDYLRRAKQKGGLPSIEHLLHDEWLAALRDQPSFAAFVASL